jgi:hypothetical protein
VNQHVKLPGPIQTFYTAHNSLFTAVSVKRLSAFSQLTSYSSFSTTHNPQQLFSQPQLYQTHPKLDHFLACLQIFSPPLITTQSKVFLACFFSTSPLDFFHHSSYVLLVCFQIFPCPLIVSGAVTSHGLTHTSSMRRGTRRVKHDYHHVE